jgi:hypothetical protein
MKRVFAILAAVGLTAVVTFLLVTRHMADARADRLDRALTDAEARLTQLESDLDAARRQIADFTETQNELRARRSAAASTRRSEAKANGSNQSGPAGTPEMALSSDDGGPTGSPRLINAAVPVVAVGPVLFAATSGSDVTNLVRIEGTSTIHDWQVEGHMIGGTARFPAGLPSGQAGKDPARFDASVSIFIPVRSLQSVEPNGRPYSDAMDRIMHDKLLGDKFPRITYALKSLSPKEEPDQDGLLHCEAVGDLAVAGITNTVTMPVSVYRAADGKLQFSGSLRVKMTDFKITPPSPSFTGNVIKTGDEVTLRFTWWVKPVTKLEASR